MALAVRGLGQPWVHSGVACSHCQVLPIEGYRYKCEICSDHNLCEKCFRQGHPHSGHRFVQIARDSSRYHPPYQVFYIVCNECGQAPIEGRCHHHRWRPNLYLCNNCHSKRPATANPASEWEILDEPKIATICRTHSPVYHFHRQCGSCGICPITGPRFDSITYPEYSLCLICFDEKFIKGSVKNEDYLRIERPEAHKVRHVFMYACRNCGEVPIDGPAYVNRRLPDKVLCLLCYMNVQASVQLEYSRVDAPSQYGEPALAVGQPDDTGTVSVEDYTKLAQEFERFREEKEAAGRVVASSLWNRVREVEQLKRELEEAQRVSADYSNRAEELEILKIEKQEVTRLRADYSSLVEAFERLKVEKEEAIAASLDYSSLAEELRVKEEEAMRVNAQYSSLVQELEILKAEKEEDDRVKADYFKLKEEKEEATTMAAMELSSLKREIEKLKEENDQAARLSAEKFASLVEENDKLKIEKEEAREYALLSKELERLDKGEEEVANSPDEYVRIVQEVEKLKEDNLALAQELETLREHTGEAARASAEEYANLTVQFEEYREEKEHAAELAVTNYSTLAEELGRLKEEKESELGVKAEDLANLIGELDVQKQLKVELEQDYANLVQKCEKLIEDKAWLVQELENLYKEKEEVARLAAENDALLTHEVERIKEEKNEAVRAREEEHANLVEECQKLMQEKEAAASEHFSLLQRLETLDSDKETAMRVTAEYSVIVEEVERLKEEKEEREQAARLSTLNYSKLCAEFEKVKIEKEDASYERSKSQEELERLKGEIEEMATLYTSLVEKLEKLEEEKGKKEGEARLSEAAYSALLEELGTLKKEKEEAEEAWEGDQANLLREMEKLKAEKEAAETLASSLTVELEKLEAEATSDYASLAQDFERYRQEKGDLVVQDTPEYKQLLREYEQLKREKAADFMKLFQDLQSAEEELEALRAESAAEQLRLTEEYDELKAGKAEAAKKSAEEYSRLSEELQKLKSTYAFDLPGYGKCAQVALCTYGAMVLKKKISLEQGYAKSSLSRTDSKTLREAEKFIAEAARELDGHYEDFVYEAKTLTDEEAQEFYLFTALPAHNKKTSVKAGVTDISELSLELGEAKKRFSK